MSDRPIQPTCGECNHPRSFHGGGRTACHALGCKCRRWRRPKVPLVKKKVPVKRPA